MIPVRSITESHGLYLPKVRNNEQITNNSRSSISGKDQMPTRLIATSVIPLEYSHFRCHHSAVYFGFQIAEIFETDGDAFVDAM